MRSRGGAVSSAASLLLNAVGAAAMARTTFRPRVLSARMAAMDSLGGPEVAVLGGGFGGLYTALRLCSLDWSGGPRPQVTLVDRSERFSFSPMLYELVTGTATAWEVAPLYEDLLAGTGIDFVHGEIRGVNEQERVVTIAPSGRDKEYTSERQLPYDQCVLAFGIQPQTTLVDGASEHALQFQTAEHAMGLKRRLIELRQPGAAVSSPRVAIVGGGYVGVELAANLAGMGGSERVTLIHRSASLLPNAVDFSRGEAHRRLLDAGVEVLLETDVKRVSPDALTLSPRSVAGAVGSDVGSAGASYEFPADLTVWTAGTRPASVVSSLGLPLNGNGRIVTDATLRVSGRPRTFALGDAAAVMDATGTTVPATAQAAMQQADYAAWNVRAAVRSQPPLPFRYTALGEMLSLGNDAASVAALGQLVKLSGPLAATPRRAVYAARMPTSQQASLVLTHAHPIHRAAPSPP